ncbi:MAG: hypothetical protein LBV55_03200 [Acholeplasmatales bacterium]|jgi:hypothetical protein|nr:hypothetical protein [Acholeplasmatales bacterium]
MAIIGETIFDVLYLLTAIGFGLFITIKSKNKQFLLFGLAVLILGLGDAGHLVPRIYALNNGGTANYPQALGIGTLITSITMTIFYLLLYHFYQIRYHKNNKVMTIVLYALAFVRIVLCALPQNAWTSSDAPYIWGIIRNIPFYMMGILIIYLFFTAAKNDKRFKFYWLAILISFIFYSVVVIGADFVSILGMMMLPKTICYVYLIIMGFIALIKGDLYENQSSLPIV